VSNEQVEKVARALANAVGARNGAPYIVNPLALMKTEMRERFEGDARAAIAAYGELPNCVDGAPVHCRCDAYEPAPSPGAMMDNADLVKRIEDNLARWVSQGGSTKTETHGLLREAATALRRAMIAAQEPQP